MVRQAAKRLCADDVAVTALYQLDHLSRQQPALAHLGTQRDDALGLFHQLLEGAGGVETGVGLGLEHGALHAVQPVEQLVGTHLHGQLAAVEDMVLAHVEDAVLHEAHQTREVDLAVLTLEELLQVVVAQRAVLDVDLAHDADFDLRHTGDGNGLEVLCDEGEGVLHLAGGEALARQQHTTQTLDPEVYHLIGSAFFVLIRSDLIAQGAEHIAVEHAGDSPAGQRQSHLEAAVLLETREVQAGHRDVRIACLDQRLAEQVDVVGGTAAAARLGDEQGRVLEVVLAAVQRVEELADDQQCRIAGVVVDIFQAQLRHSAAAVAKDLALVAVVAQGVFQQAELGDGHVRDEDGVSFLHLRGEFGVIVFHRFLLCYFLSSSRSSSAANRLRRRILTAPRFVISSIFSWV